MKKYLFGLSMIVGFTATTAFAGDPLANFPAGEWRGTYVTSNCTPNSTGAASLVVTNENYKPDGGYGAAVYFGGSLQLYNFPKTATMPDVFSQVMALDRSITKVQEVGSGVGVYGAYLVLDPSGIQLNNPLYAYDTSDQSLLVQYSSNGYCKLQISVKASVSH